MVVVNPCKAAGVSNMRAAVMIKLTPRTFNSE